MRREGKEKCWRDGEIEFNQLNFEIKCKRVIFDRFHRSILLRRKRETKGRREGSVENVTCCFILSGRYIRICRNSRFFLRLFYAADRDRSFKFGELTTVNDAWCAETPVPGRAQRANVTFTLHSFPNFTTWLYVVKIDIGNSCVCVCVYTKGAKYRSKKRFRERKLSARKANLFSPAYSRKYLFPILFSNKTDEIRFSRATFPIFTLFSSVPLLHTESFLATLFLL